MPRYFFDTTDGDSFVREELGLVCNGILEARDEATAGLADLARDAIPGRIRRELSVAVRDETDWPLLEAAHPRHVDVREDQDEVGVVRHGHALERFARRACKLHQEAAGAKLAPELLLEQGSHVGLVVDDQDQNVHSGALLSSQRLQAQ